MNARLLNVAIASIRFDRVPPGVTSIMLERTILPLYGDILEWEYALRRHISLKIAVEVNSASARQLK